ncbi:MMPL family transporter [Nonomuraea jabiensis]|uniref:RND superfamily putative drug exporter n=1 Tax=Nonomuraea jabiensis TaxID=882448 RepID=A0A7W9G139_9ACTN|nr:MMPL family transporter [Nonomuraea jabiensis]MBB5775207.1 RND superfamily putative drug exporter [Nonomuraea jabiensis]
MGRLVYRGRWTLLALSLVAALLVAPLALSGRAVGGGFEDPRADSATAARWSAEWYAGQSPDVVVLYRHPSVKVRDPRYKKAVHDSLRGLPAEYVRGMVTYWTTGSKAMVSRDGHSTYAIVTLKGAKRASYAAVAARLRTVKNLRVAVGGPVPVQAELDGAAAADLARVGAIAAPVLLVLLVVVFGSLVAALLPLVVGLLAVLGALALLPAVSVYSFYAVVLLGLGLAAEYSLLLLRAFREEIAGGASNEQAVAGTLATAGRTVGVAGVCVAASLLGLTLFPQPFLGSLGPAAAGVALVSSVAALLVAPALLGVLGRRVDALRVRPMPVRRDGGLRDGGLWDGARRPVVYLVTVTVALVALAGPLPGAEFGNADHRALPAASEGRRVAETIERDFARNALSPIDVHVVVEPLDGTAVTALDVRPITERLERLPHVTGVETAGLSRPNRAVRLAVRHDLDPLSAQAGDLVAAIRSAAAGPDVRQVVVGGPVAARLDLLAGLSGTLPWLAVVVCSAMALVLALAFGSLVLPVPAVVASVLSAGASFGVIGWVAGSGFLGFAGPLDVSVALLIGVVAFGLSVVHQVFLVSEARTTATGAREVIIGAALLVMAVAGTFAAAGIAVVRLLGVGLCVAVAVDAVLVRLLLVPAAMRLLGPASWWPLRSPGISPAASPPVPEVEPPALAPPRDRRPLTGGRPAITVKGRPAVFGADTDPVPVPVKPPQPGWVKVAAGRTRAVRADPGGAGWTWVEVDD